MKTIKLLSLSVIATLLFSACSSDDDAPEVINEEEEITTLNVFLTPVGGGDTVTFTFRDLDGTNPENTGGTLQAGTTYVGETQFLNEREDEDVTEEVLEEGEEHQVFFTASNSLNVTTSYDDTDVNGNPIGIEFTLVAGEASQGNFRVTLIHEGDKFAEGASEGIYNPNLVGGETDIEVTFNVTVE
ncbi:type 1 periplasmic binding fold superfamily protein [Psychroflexus sp. CAK8W]|uniref:Type 1 periplasmic binding fold superfamily protein n=1 Tax=Psychroflexus longus TaxID=2873596 RepID=A0ABS7XKR5_9FLAO|nr:type 1 periplasmic binding fold superfamily protein [Psychroflexus longus]MBZ9778666.1 type 1 periplasmic binding fold superfamily protein [Psychroflexus longus]